MRLFTGSWPSSRRVLLIQQLLAVALFSLHLCGHAQPKASQTDQGKRQVGDVELIAQWSGASSLYVLAHNKKSGIRAEYSGACSEILMVRVLSVGRLNLEPFLASQSGADLPIHDVIKVMREALVEECEQLQVVRTTVRPFNPAHGAFSYEGTLTKTGGWRLQDGRVNTPYDNAYVFAFQAQDASGLAGLSFKGSCEKDPTLLVVGSRDRQKTLSLTNYTDAALAASPQYAAECPGVTRIRYTIDPMPGAILCKQQGDCFLEASLDKQWVVDASQFKEEQREYNNPIRNTKDMFEVLAAGRFDIMEDYRPMFSFFVMNYFNVYSDQCKSHIRQPVGRQTKFVKQTVDPNRGVTREEDFVTVNIEVEKEYAPIYDAHQGPGHMWAVSFLFRMNSKPSVTGSPIDNAFEAGFALVDQAKQIADAIEGNCTEDRVLTMQQNMVNFARALPPVTSKYTTDKKPKTKYLPTGPSAPEFAAAYLEKQARARSEENARANLPRPRKEVKDVPASPAQPGDQATSAPPAAIGNDSAKPTAPVEASLPESPARNSADDAKQRAIAMQELQRAHGQAMKEAFQDFQGKLKSARPQERRALQQEFRQLQQERQQELQRKLRELAGR
jgi:hypothetical protein